MEALQLNNNGGFGEEKRDQNGEEIWLGQGGDVSNDHSLFYAADDFPPLPDFPCMSSSSSNSSTPAPSTAAATSACSSSSSSAASWAVLNSDQQQPPQDQELRGIDELDCINVMEDFDCMGINQLIEDSNEIWDPSPLFESTEPIPMEPFHHHQIGDQIDDQDFLFLDQTPPTTTTTTTTTDNSPNSVAEDLAVVFFEWLKSNKEAISAEELRSIKIKKSTIESAAKRLGGGKQGMKQLLKLILQWVQHHRLHKSDSPDPNPNPNHNPNPIPPPCFNYPPPPPVGPGFPSMVSYLGGYNNAMGIDPYHMQMAQPPPPPPPPVYYNAVPDGFPGYCNQMNEFNVPYQFFPGGGDGMVRIGSSATKEARKKRMARQRRIFSHHRGHNNSSQHQHQQYQHQMIQPGDGSGSIPGGGWVYWPPAAAVVGPTMMGSMQPVVPERPAGSSQRQPAADKKQGFKSEKNLKFLLQKVLKQSDVGNLGRIVLPKKEAETHLPELEARDGIPIAMEDIGTSRVWNMRYRFWPNNKSRMYLLENTGDFVRSNGLQEGDFIVIYSDVKCGKYMIRGVKVRPQQPQGSKSETNKTSNKAQKTQNLGSPSGSSALSPLTQRQ